jgi:RNA 2',3'-cyclic 3'-phosphodiesterase
MRLFVALEIPETVRENLAAIRMNFSSVGLQLRWVPPENLHVTLKFIGGVPGEKLQPIIEALRSVRADKPVQVKFSGLGGSPAGVYWAAIESSVALKTLAAQIDQSLRPLGIVGENRPFHPHVTLARFKDRKILKKIDELIHKNGTDDHGQNLKYDFGSLIATEFHLMESKTLPTGPVYSKVQSFPFAGAAN